MKIIIDSLIKPAWKLLFTIPLEIVGIITFFYPDIKINRITIADILPWYWWIIIGLIILLLGLPLEFAKLIKARGDKKDNNNSVKISSRHQRGGQTAQTIINFNDTEQERDLYFKTPKFRLEPVRSENFVGVRLYNDQIEDFVDKKAEVIGFGEEGLIGKPINTMEIDMIVPEKRELTWENGDFKIESGDHDLIKIVTVDESGMHFCLKKANITMLHNIDRATFRIGVEVRGKLGDNPIVPQRCCITFSIRKDVIEDQNGGRILWAVVMPTLTEGNCDYAITMKT